MKMKTCISVIYPLYIHKCAINTCIYVWTYEGLNASTRNIYQQVGKHKITDISVGVLRSVYVLEVVFCYIRI